MTRRRYFLHKAGHTWLLVHVSADFTLCSFLLALDVTTHLLLQDLSEDEIGSLAVNTLALLRGEAAESSGDSQRSYPLPSPSTRRRRKPARPTVRTLF